MGFEYALKYEIVTNPASSTTAEKDKNVTEEKDDVLAEEVEVEDMATFLTGVDFEEDTDDDIPVIR
jgi:hypothetical protein